MTLNGRVVKAFREERELVGKDGIKKHVVVSRVLLMQNTDDNEMAQVVSYDADFALPKEGTLNWKTPPVKKYENYRGMVAEVIV